MIKVLTVFGTRPEAIKMAPLIAELERHPGKIDNRNCLTGQHKDMVAPLIELFGIRVDYDLQLMRENQTLEHITVAVLQEVGRILRAEPFDLVLVQGDTTTSMAAALAAFYAGVRVGHVEAGLRTFDKHNPYPEESNRKMIDAVADVFFPHTDMAKGHLLNEGIPEAQIEVTGNTVIDALLDVSNRPYSFAGSVLDTLPFDSKRIVLVTAHRRESFGAPFRAICAALRRIAEQHADVCLLYPVHLNPQVREVAHATLGNCPRVRLVAPQDYATFVALLQRAELVLTDSGGIQEEAPALGKPVLVLREKTERPEAIAAGAVRLVGTDTDTIVATAMELLRPDSASYTAMATPRNVYGDGRASERIAEVLLTGQLTQAAFDPPGERVLESK